MKSHQAILVKKLRKRLHLSQVGLATLLNLSEASGPQFISNIERGRCPIPKKSLKTLSKFVNKKIIMDSLIADYELKLKSDFDFKK